MRITRALPLLALTLPLGLGACASHAEAPQATGPRIVAAFYPLQYAADQITGGSATGNPAAGLTPAGVEPHELELSAKQVAQISDADLVLYAKGFQSAVDDAVTQEAADHSIDVTSLVTELSGPEGADPHVWLDPANMTAIGNAIAKRMDSLDPANAKKYDGNAKAFEARMSALDADMRAGLATCKQRTMVVSHAAFGYLARAYGLTQAGISGLSPDGEPTPAHVRDISDLVRQLGISTVYYETLVDPKVAQTIASETGTTAAVLDPIEGSTNGMDYEELMRADLATLRAGQGCS